MTITLNNPLLKGSLTAKSTWKELVLNSADLWRFGFFLVGSKWHLLTTVAAQHDPYCHLLLVMNSGCGKYNNVGQAKKVKQAQDFNQLQFMVHRWWSPELWLILTFHLAPSSGQNSVSLFMTKYQHFYQPQLYFVFTANGSMPNFLQIIMMIILINSRYDAQMRAWNCFSFCFFVFYFIAGDMLWLLSCEKNGKLLWTKASAKCPKCKCKC